MNARQAKKYLKKRINRLLYDYTLADNQVSKTISRPHECVNAGCVAACCITFYEGNKVFFKDNPKNCPAFKKEKKMSKLPEERHAMGHKGETNK